MKMKVLTFISAPITVLKNAGPKAPSDINEILKQQYGATNTTIIRKKSFRQKMLFEFFKTRFIRGVIVVQHPLLFNPKMYCLLPKKRTIVLIHDIAGLRFEQQEQQDKEIAIFSKFKYVIVHNERMKEFLVKEGIDPNKIYVLEIFDYLADGDINSDAKVNSDTISVMYPGNLSKDKSPFIHQLDDEKMNFILFLYGQGIERDISKKRRYFGTFSPDSISDLQGDVGLIWDGDFDDADEENTFKRYTKYNNPHKLSCCLAAGKPVIVWKKAAVADFVLKYNVGYVIDNVYDINNIDFSDFEQKKNNAVAIGNELRSGKNTKRVFGEIVKKINAKN